VALLAGLHHFGVNHKLLISSAVPIEEQKHLKVTFQNLP
jgi:hypothetical protein